ncbi:transcription factor 24 isoform X1 [Gymnogyps californianus]|uniref:transcription factor 24 isoform X1 n=1 Tax=Gymnogyps californianus TaxID=33616 RepID=UPI0021C67D2B|nr:transcription factor 24 isoform X1 [Gymnogyps californianus]
MDCGHLAESSEEISSPGAEPDSLLPSAAGSNSCLPSAAGQRAGAPPGRPAAANAARERSRVQTLRHAFLELQKTLPSVPPDTKLSKLDVLLLATTYIAHLTRSLQDEEESPGEGLGTLRGDGYLHPVKRTSLLGSELGDEEAATAASTRRRGSRKGRAASRIGNLIPSGTSGE